MDPVHEWKVPTIYPDVPSFLGVPFAGDVRALEVADAAFLGVPFEGAPGVMRTYDRSLLTPIELRKASLMYGGYLPEKDIDVFDHLKVVDFGDASIAVRAPAEEAIASATDKIGQILGAGAIPIVVGGTETVASYSLAQSLAALGGRVGAVTLDAHGDNLSSHLGSGWMGAAWIARMSEIPGIDMRHHVHVGMRGPRNFREQVDWFRQRGSRVIFPRDVREKGVEWLVNQVIDVACAGTDSSFCSVDLDVLDIGAAFGLIEPAGLSCTEVFEMLFALGREGARGLCIGWVPKQTPELLSICTWMIVYFLAGVAKRKVDS